MVFFSLEVTREKCIMLPWATRCSAQLRWFRQLLGYENHLQGTEHCLSCSGSNCRESQGIKPASYPRAKKVNTNVAILCHGCHGIPVSHKSHNRDDHESYCGLSQSITKRVYQMLQQICPISSNALLRFEFGTIVHKGNHAWWRRSWTPGSQSGNCTETWSPCRARSTVGQFVVYVSPGTTPFCWPPQMTRPSSCLGTQCREFWRRLFALNTFANCKNCRILMKDMSKNMSKIICEYVKTRSTSKMLRNKTFHSLVRKIWKFWKKLRWSLATYRFQSSLLGHTNWVPSLQHFVGRTMGGLGAARLSTSIELRVIHLDSKFTDFLVHRQI